MNTPDKAVCQEIPMFKTTVKAKNAFSPIPGAMAIGYFAMRPIKIQPTAEAIAVAVKTEP